MKILKYLVFFILVLAVSLVSLRYYNLNRRAKSKAIAINSKEAVLEAKTDKGGIQDFIWGVGFNATATFAETDEAIEKAIRIADELGVSTLRVPLMESRAGESRLARTKKLVDLAKQYNKKLFITTDVKTGDIESPDRYKLGYNYGYAIASYLKGVVPYYQMGNEMAAYSLKPNWGGKTRQDYENKKFANSVEYLRGLSEGIKAGDPEAKRVVTGHHTHYGFWIEAQKQGLDFDIVGWDWFHNVLPVPDFFAYDIDGVPTDMTKILAELGKPIWITEAGVVAGRVGEKEAASHLGEFARRAYASGRISGFFPLAMTDQAHQTQDENYKSGLVALSQLPDNIFEYGEKRLAFYEYQKLIKGIRDSQSGKHK